MTSEMKFERPAESSISNAKGLAVAAGILATIPLAPLVASAADVHKVEKHDARTIQIDVQNGKKKLIDRWRLGINDFKLTYGGGIQLIRIYPEDTDSVRMFEVEQSDLRDTVLLQVINTDGSADLIFITNADSDSSGFRPETKHIRVPAIKK